MVHSRLGSSIAAALALSFALIGSASALTAACTGAPTAMNITWSGAASAGVAPYTFLWGNGSTSTSQTVSAVAGPHTMSLQATDASSTVATTTCSAIVATSTDSTGGSSALEQIKALLKQIEALKAQIAQIIAGRITGDTNATSTPQGCFGFWRDLKRGDMGDDVKELQHELAHNDSTLFPPGLVNGIFGPKTEAALKMLQRRFGIDASGTGFFGIKSRGHFAAKCSQGDSDDDGIHNSEDADDDNDGVSDDDDKFPFNPNATSTSLKKDKGWHWGEKKSNRGPGGGNDNDNDDDD